MKSKSLKLIILVVICVVILFVTLVILKYGNKQQSHISYDKEDGFRYIDNEIIVYFIDDYTSENLKEVLNYLKGKVVDTSLVVDKYKIRLPKSYNYEQLDQLCEELEEKFDYIDYATHDTVFDMDDFLL